MCAHACACACAPSPDYVVTWDLRVSFRRSWLSQGESVIKALRQGPRSALHLAVLVRQTTHGLLWVVLSLALAIYLMEECPSVCLAFPLCPVLAPLFLLSLLLPVSVSLLSAPVMFLLVTVCLCVHLTYLPGYISISFLFTFRLSVGGSLGHHIFCSSLQIFAC